MKAFTLIELLVVVAIIGILAAVGVVAYNGYTSSAKVSTSKSNHNLVVKKISLTIQQCNIDGSVNIKYKYKDTNSYNVNCYPNKFTFFSDYLINDMDMKADGKILTNLQEIESNSLEDVMVLRVMVMQVLFGSLEIILRTMLLFVHVLKHHAIKAQTD